MSALEGTLTREAATMNAREGDLFTASPDEPVGEAARRMAREDRNFLTVVDADGRLLGVVTSRDLALRVLAEALDPIRTRLADIMTHPVVAGSDRQSTSELDDLLDRHGIHRLPVVDREGRLVGLHLRSGPRRGKSATA